VLGIRGFHTTLLPINDAEVAAGMPVRLKSPEQVSGFDATHCRTIDLRTSAVPRAGGAALEQHPPFTVDIGRVLRDRYVIDQRLGSGGRGTVYKALDQYRADLPETHQYVAIKFLNETGGCETEQLAALRREFYCTQMLSHRNVVKVHELDRDADLHFYTMELLEGELLSSVMDRLNGAPMARPYAWHIIREIGAGLAHAHARQVIHGDLKPHNIMITPCGDVRILDFGSSSFRTAHDAADAMHRGNTYPPLTPAYASCELLAGRAADPRDDLYAFACLSYELIAGSHPFQRRPATVARDHGIIANRPRGLRRQQWKALACGLSWCRAARPASTRAWLDDLIGERPARSLQGPAMGARTAALGAAIVFTATAWVALAHWATGLTAGSAIAPVAAATVQHPTESAADKAAEAAGQRTSDPPAPLAANAFADAKRPAASAALLPIVVSRKNYRVRAGENFAEIRVHRTSLMPGDNSFVWWTEAASAKPGVDYVDQEKAIQTFPRGGEWTSFFIKLVPKELRTSPKVFYIDVGKAGHGASSVPITRAAIWLPMTRGRS
jgi:serine/threonine protein kinase